MKMYTVKEFIANGYVIPNANSDVTVEFDKVPDPWGDKVDVVTISYKGFKLVQFGKGYRYNSVFGKDVDKAIELGIVNADCRDFHAAVIDALYYIYNPLRFRSLTTKKLLVGFWKALYKRTDYRSYMSSYVIDRMLAELDKELTNRYDKPEHPKGSEQYNQLCNDDIRSVLLNRVVICHLTGKLLISGQFSYYKLDNKEVAIDRKIDIKKYKLKLVRDFYLVRHTQILYGDRVYDKGEGTCKCPECNEEVPTQAIEPEDGICYKCLEKHYKIHNYSTRVPELLKFKAKNVKPREVPIYLGCELEYETSDREVASVKVGKLLKNHAIMKADGSIRNGFEIVSCPATLDIHMEEFNKFYSNLPSELSIASNVGMHVHVSKAPLSLFTIGKITAFMNKVDNKPFVTFIAGREPNHYCNVDPKRTVTFPWIAKQHSERYNALNLNPKETIEFRIFSTPMSFEEFAYKMQFCKALVDYSMPASLAIPLKEQLSHTNFISWVLKQVKTYPQLANKIKEFA